MPYVAEHLRESIDASLNAFIKVLRDTCTSPEALAGVLNYSFTRIVMQTLFRDGVRYHKIALFRGILATIGSEFERRVGQPYEKGARIINGDVPEYDTFDRDHAGRRSI